MENLLKKQLAQIKARALALTGRADGSDAAAGAAATTDHGREIIDAVIRTGAVFRAADTDRLKTSRRLPWWFRRRLNQERQSGFEGEFQSLLAELSDGVPLEFEHAVPGEALALDAAGYYLVRLVGNQIDPLAAAEAERLASLAAWPADIVRTVVGQRRNHAIVDLADEVSPPSLLFLDIETAGLSANTYVFLCGLMYWADGEFVVEQAFARDYDEEEGLLRHARAAIDRFGTVVTYNGASFDIPFLRTRMAVHRVPDIEPVGSVDLLHSSRRVFREMLPNCRLVTVERHLRGVDRVDDIPSRFIPRAYHEFVRSRDARIMRNVVYHNRMDLFTMAVILNHFAATPLAAPGIPEAGATREIGIAGTAP
jgi:uncharacterized protein YprB with RNaseH-like and TPR domain